ncbi:MAG TPA: Gfo/Idh/MocA family oxidoreductase, partial [Coriobacteriia bacterium]|nr:Gfo/Idh/MocA family oxidoreductase [Coriobacteriia bacterium]
MIDNSRRGADGARRRPSVALVGIHGYGTAHLRNILRLQVEGALRFVALVDPTPIDHLASALVDPLTAGDADAVRTVAATPWYPDLSAFLADPAAGAPDVVVVCTPIHTHFTLASQAVRAGCDVLLEKPPTSSLDEFEALLALVAETGRSVQVGFQTFGSTALPTLHALVASGEIGDMTGVGAVGTWLRYESYWTRSAWTGRRTVAGRPVVDGVVTNPLAHAVATSLRLAGATAVADVATIELDQYRANRIEVDDTTAVCITTVGGLPVSLGLTLCASTQTSPRIVVQGRTGQAVLDYDTDTITVTGAAGVRTIAAQRTDLLTNLLRHRADPSVALLCP